MSAGAGLRVPSHGRRRGLWQKCLLLLFSFVAPGAGSVVTSDLVMCCGDEVMWWLFKFDAIRPDSRTAC